MHFLILMPERGLGMRLAFFYDSHTSVRKELVL